MAHSGSMTGRLAGYVVLLLALSALTAHVVDAKKEKEKDDKKKDDKKKDDDYYHHKICFPGTSTVRRQDSSTGAWETVSVDKLRIGDSVQCLVRQPAFLPDGRVVSAPGGELSTCHVYDYKKAMPSVNAEYTYLKYQRSGSDKTAVLAASANHHVLSAKTGQAVQVSSVKVGDELLVLSENGRRVVTARVVKVYTAPAEGAFSPMLTMGGLPIVDGAVAYPTSGSSDVGLDAKHWGQYFLAAPKWQSLNNMLGASAGQTLAEMGAQEGQDIGAFTRKFYAVAEEAANDGRTFRDWAAVAHDIYSAITVEGKVYTEEEALAVFNTHIVKSKAPAAGVMSVMSSAA